MLQYRLSTPVPATRVRHGQRPSVMHDRGPRVAGGLCPVHCSPEFAPPGDASPDYRAPRGASTSHVPPPRGTRAPQETRRSRVFNAVGT